MVAIGMKGGKVCVTFGTRQEMLAPHQAVELAEQMARHAFVCVNGTEPPLTRSVLASEIRKRFRGEIRDAIVTRGVVTLRKLLEEGRPPEELIEELADQMLARIS